METKIKIPPKAYKYILFQRTMYLYFQNIKFLHYLVVRVLIRMFFWSYNNYVAFESAVFRSRISRLFNADITSEYESIKKYLPENPGKILDIGSGVAGIDVLIYRHYEVNPPDIYLLDKTSVTPGVYYGFKKDASFYNSLEVASDLLYENGIPKDKIYTEETDGSGIKEAGPFGFVISLLSWGFHYPVETYLERVYEIMRPGGVLIIDVRNGKGGEDLIFGKFSKVEKIYDGGKHCRLVAYK